MTRPLLAAAALCAAAAFSPVPPAPRPRHHRAAGLRMSAGDGYPAALAEFQKLRRQQGQVDPTAPLAMLREHEAMTVAVADV